MKQLLAIRSYRRQAGFTLVELMVGVVVGLLATLMIAKVLGLAEGQRRSATSGSDAQVSGGLAIYTLDRQLKMAGYGLTVEGAALGCSLSGTYAGAVPAGMPAVLAPVLITAGADGAPDTIRLLSSSKASFSLPAKLTAPFYDPNDVIGDKARRIALTSSLGMSQNDLLALVYQDSVPPAARRDCQLFQITATPGLKEIARQTTGSWNSAGFPSAVAGEGAFVINLGVLNDVTFSVTADYRLRQTTRALRDQTSADQDLQSNIVGLTAFYGKDTNGDDVVDTFNKDTPTNNAEWMQVRAVRLALLARSTQFESEEVTKVAPSWDVGTFATVSGAATCGSSKCVALKADVTTDWKHYRYKVFELLVPLRNQLWRADFTQSASAPPLPTP
ncbi:PilW family protein [Pelomonas sp. V22]|uniref:PilW family protein n=1 Tax=Pelomonas sp. V22 TaxID=2822139 RepID=UPI0024A9CEB2|nr:PilW family protein [Pelomonas sp. V22]MDI4632691.1 PilW family protein [Pelomonas sp. V22]